MPANAGKRVGDHAPKTTMRRRCGYWRSKACVIGKRDQAGAHVALARVACHGCHHAVVHQRSMAPLPAHRAGHLRSMGPPASPGAPGCLSPTAAAATSPSAVCSGRETALGRTPWGGEHTGGLRHPRSGGDPCGQLAGQCNRHHQLCRTRYPDTAAESSAPHPTYERVLHGPDVVREPPVVVVGV